MTESRARQDAACPEPWLHECEAKCPPSPCGGGAEHRAFSHLIFTSCRIFGIPSDTDTRYTRSHPSTYMSSYKFSPAETILVDLVHDLRQHLGNIETSVYCLGLVSDSAETRA